MKISSKHTSESGETHKAEKKKKHGKKETAEEAKNDSPKEDTKVELSSKKKNEAAQKTRHVLKHQEKSESQELSEAETLVDHVDSGKLSPHEKELALNRVGEILKKYGHI